jgi:hypothetical protein
VIPAVVVFSLFLVSSVVLVWAGRSWARIYCHLSSWRWIVLKIRREVGCLMVCFYMLACNLATVCECVPLAAFLWSCWWCWVRSRLRHCPFAVSQVWAVLVAQWFE